MSAEWAPLDERPGAGTPQCARRDDRQRRLIFLCAAATLWFIRGQVMVYGPRSCRRLIVLSVEGKSENICHPAASGCFRC